MDFVNNKLVKIIIEKSNNILYSNINTFINEYCQKTRGIYSNKIIDV